MVTDVMAPQDHKVSVRGVELHYLEWGEPTSPTIVLLHGLRGYAHTWDNLARELVADFHLLALDQRGRGESDWAPAETYNRDSYVADLEAFVDQLGLERFILIGHSMGGANTLGYAALHPERLEAVVVEDMGPTASPPAPGFARISGELDVTPARFATWAEAEAFVRTLRPGTPDATVAQVAASSLKTLPDGQVTWKYDLDGIRTARRLGVGNGDLWPGVRALTCPTLVVRGGDSDILAVATAEAMVAANPLISWVEIAGASHFVHDDKPAEFNRAIMEFLCVPGADRRGRFLSGGEGGHNPHGPNPHAASPHGYNPHGGHDADPHGTGSHGYNPHAPHS